MLRCGPKYSPDRKIERPLVHLSRYAGILQADGYAAVCAVSSG